MYKIGPKRDKSNQNKNIKPEVGYTDKYLACK